MKLAIGIREVALVHVIDRNVATIALGRRVKSELDLSAAKRLIGAEMLSVEQREGKINVHSHPLETNRMEARHEKGKTRIENEIIYYLLIVY